MASTWQVHVGGLGMFSSLRLEMSRFTTPISNTHNTPHFRVQQFSPPPFPMTSMARMFFAATCKHTACTGPASAPPTASAACAAGTSATPSWFASFASQTWQMPPMTMTPCPSASPSPPADPDGRCYHSKPTSGTRGGHGHSDAPPHPRGCDAQAWSVTEVLRVWRWLQGLPVSSPEASRTDD